MKRFVALAALVLALAACSKDKDPDPPAQLVDIKPRVQVKKVWSIGLGGGTEALRLGLRPAYDDGKLFVADHDGEVLAVQAENGRVIWRNKIKRMPYSGGPGVGGGRVVIGSSEGDVLAFNAADGKQLWKVNIAGDVISPPAVTDTLIVVRAVNGTLHALNPTDGKELWVYEQLVPRLSVRGTAPPVIVGDVVIAGFDNGKVAAVDRTNGTVVWESQVAPSRGRTELERLIDIDSAVRVVDKDVFVVGYQGRAAMLALDSGQIWWARDSSSEHGLVLNDDALYISGAMGDITALNRKDGAPLWDQAALHKRAPSGPAIDGPAVVVGDYEGYIHWLDAATGEFLAREKTDGSRVSNAPVAADGMVFVLTDGGRLSAFRRVGAIAEAPKKAEKAPPTGEAPATTAPSPREPPSSAPPAEQTLPAPEQAPPAQPAPEQTPPPPPPNG
jgi:outer membrane protein assembly factor BamB